MNRNRRRIARTGIAAGALAALVLLAGCASESAPKPSESAKPSATAEVSGTLTVSAAASLQPAFEQLTADFTKLHPGVTFEKTTFDGSSVLATQIIGGAPVDVFASADAKNMQKVVDAKLANGDPVSFATSRLEIAVAPGNPLGIKTLADLAKAGADGEKPVVVICAPEVPCGNAAKQLLDRDKVALTPASEEQNVTAVLTKVRAGEADAGLVYRTDVMRAGAEVTGVSIPGAEEAAGKYLIVPIVGSKSADAAKAFSEYLRSDAAQSLLEKLGFSPA